MSLEQTTYRLIETTVYRPVQVSTDHSLHKGWYKPQFTRQYSLVQITVYRLVQTTVYRPVQTTVYMLVQTTVYRPHCTGWYRPQCTVQYKSVQYRKYRTHLSPVNMNADDFFGLQVLLHQNCEPRVERQHVGDVDGVMVEGWCH